jgi:dynein heavy chain
MLGLIKGRTMLPMPSSKLTSSDTTPDKDKAHIFESIVFIIIQILKKMSEKDLELFKKF